MWGANLNFGGFIFMCGITGFFGVKNKNLDETTVIKNMLSMIEHRGPDQAGYYVNNSMGLGTMRLSIIDLAAGIQPLSDGTGQYWISYNGELYNYIELRRRLQVLGHHFSTESDTEVVLRSWMEWGDEALEKFNGAFAFAIYDTVKDEVFIARDRFGKRPLFYTQTDGGYLFASEMKCFFGFPGFEFKFDEMSLSSILAHWTPLPSQTPFQGIRQLPPGSIMTLRGAQCEIRPYYALDFRAVDFDGTENEAKEEIRNTLEQAVKLRLRSDVPMGLYLSGGVDSSVLTSIAARIIKQKPLRTFSVEFEDKNLDESSDQQLVSALFSTKHERLIINHKDIVDNFSATVFHAEMPLFRTAPVPMYMLSKHVRSTGIKAILSGEGADEVFLGYNIFKETLLRSQWDTTDHDEKKRLLAKLYPYMKSFSEDNDSNLMGFYNAYAKEKIPGLFSHEIRFQNGRFASRLLKTKNDPFAGIQAWVAKDPVYSALSPTQKAQWLEFNTLLSGYLLSSQGERMGLAHGIENRCPFLDINVQKLASSINLRFDDGFTEKYMLRMAYDGILPDRIIHKAKTPYRAPDSGPFVEHALDYLNHLCESNALDAIELINPVFAKALIKKVVERTLAGGEDITVRDNQAFVYLMSLIELDKWFVKRQGAAYINPCRVDKLLVQAVDARH
ncbi:asparagine synthase (glutamine-hydrolyzing) [Pseudomonas syringae]|uniref:asparagine synthase (glutamine-hydrolyzing) n=1 Tax=Pseudomonas syringae TaxID=317 RepID=UPI001F41BBE0|nr:asparagine synthase (glutamine-hydrolyzing) [Pseudomonas syringae]